MKKLLLASNGGFLFEHGYDLIGIPRSEIKVGWVTTASKGVPNHAYLERHRAAMAQGRINFTEADIESKTLDELRDFFKDKNVIHMEGGNTFYLLKAIRKIGFDTLIKELIDREVVYVGTSAGAYVACPTIEMATWGPNVKDMCGLNDLNALNLVPFLMKVHYTDDVKELITEKIKQCKYPVRVLRDGQGILVEDDVNKFVGMGEEVTI